MCGITGCLSVLGADQLRETVSRMTGAIKHRGPDADGFYFEAGVVGFGHRRLSIIDLSETGAQPMTSPSGRFVVTFNGEIYNHLALRRELGAHVFRGTSDTETLLAAVDQWGLAKTLEKCAGMFAFGLWDKKERALYLARDRMGEKPLYYGKIGQDFAFASELKALRQHPSFRPTVDPAALNLFLEFGYIPAPLSIFPNVKKLPPAHFLKINERGETSQPVPYWSLTDAAARGLADPLREEEAEGAVEEMLRQVLKEQAVADVPLGCFLSGGIDSSLIAAMLTEFLPQKLRTFSIGFGDGGFDESSFAAEVARSIGTDHTELRATPRDALAIVPSLPSLFGEPFADVSQIPSLLLARLARPHVTVALTGDGGDEIFAGYNRYLFLERARAIPSASAPILGALAAFAGNFSGLERALRLPQISEKLEKLAMVSRAGSATDAYWALAAQGLQAAKGYAPVENASAAFSGVPGQQLRDQLLYLPDDILVKVDRAAMASSLETRAPLIDARLVELAWRLPLHLRTANGQGKIMLRRLLAKRVPPALWQRPKAGFTPPVGSWLRGELRPWAEELLSDRALKDTGLPGAEAVKRQWTQTRKSGRGALRLWPALMAQAWLKSEL